MGEANQTTETGRPAPEADHHHHRAHGERTQHFVEALKHSGRVLHERIEQRPVLGFVLAGGAALLAASTIGVGEVLAASVIGYAVYRKFGGRVRPREDQREDQHHDGSGSGGATAAS